MQVDYFPLEIASHPLELRAETVHLWHARLDDETIRFDPETSLSLEEQSRAAKLKVPRIRIQFIQARSILRHLLGRYLGVEPQAVPIEYQDGGKPLLTEPFGHLHFNVSHSENRGLFAFTLSGRVGIDLERVRSISNMEGLVDRFFAANERERFRSLLPEARQGSFFRAWTCKEAILKAIGRGVQSLDCCEVAFEPDSRAKLLRLHDDTEPHQRWYLHQWSPEPEFLAALAVELVRQDSGS